MRVPRLLIVGGRSGWHRLRQRLIRDVWAGPLPSTLPSVALDQSIGGLSGVAGIAQVDVLTCALPLSGESTVHVLTPSAVANGRCLIVHGGHSITYHDATHRMEQMVEAALADGWTVAGVCMNGYASNGYNPSPLALDGGISINDHDFSPVEQVGVHAWRFFVEPVVLTINYLETIGFAHVAMTGLSGGGWTTDMAAAVDTRIRASYPTFGSVPFALRQANGGPGDNGDWEQLAARSWWDILSRGDRDHEVAYALGCGDRGRRRMQVLGTGDTVFPVGSVLEDVTDFEAWINARVPAGQHEVLVDTTATDHEYSDETIAAILADAEEWV